MDIATGRKDFITTVNIPLGLRQEIKNAGMTVNGALIAGWAAIKDAKHANQEIFELRENMNRYRNGFLKMREENAALRARLETFGEEMGR